MIRGLDNLGVHFIGTLGRNHVHQFFHHLYVGGFNGALFNGPETCKSGFTFSRFGHSSNATQTPKLPDWALADMRQPYNAGNPDCIAAAGFFNERWQPQKAE